MRDQVDRAAVAERLDLAVEPRGTALDRLAPVEGERPHVPVVVELEQHRDVVLPVQAGGGDVRPLLGRLAVDRELELLDPAPDDVERAEPDAIRLALRVDDVEQRAHDPRQDEHLALLRPPPTAGGGAARALERLRPQLLAEQVLILLVERDEHLADAIHVAVGECVLERFETWCHLVGHGAPFRSGSFVLREERAA